MAEEGKADDQLFQLLSGLLQQVESLTNQEEVELRSKIEALGLEVTKVPSKAVQPLGELDIAKQLDELSEKLEDVDEKISSAMAADPQVQTLLSGTADVWMPVITATAEERQKIVRNSNTRTEKLPPTSEIGFASKIPMLPGARRNLYIAWAVHPGSDPEPDIPGPQPGF
ncbi:hypothetical protein CIPAW_16G067000 [Carya illinoinensis]|uniref:Uncharacterized protein n=1 Tax=Carya illinoinensis TaxID=32201 RepID=A0A8T1N291_CARIL|nr:hypothetical protein CIPAW_16G067000 [Carya illinoinensis]